MADIKISELPTAAQANIDDLLEASQVSGPGYVTRHISLDQVATVVADSVQIADKVETSEIDWSQIINEPATFPPTLPIAQADVTNLISDLAQKAPLASPTFTGDPRGPTPVTTDNDTSLATTAFVRAAISTYSPAPDLSGYAPLASPVFTGNPTAPTPAPGDADTSIATTAFVAAALAAGASIAVGTTPPASPGTNMLWWSSELGQMFIWYNDGNTTQWVPASPSAATFVPAVQQDGVLRFYSESVLASAAADIRVTIPANTKKIEIEYHTVAASGDPALILQVMQGATPYAGATYQYGVHFQAQNTPSAQTQSNQTGFMSITAGGWAGTIRPVINRTLNVFRGDMTFSGLTSNFATFYSGQCGFSAISGITDMSTITGFRLVHGTAVNFNAGSFMRCFVVT